MKTLDEIAAELESIATNSGSVLGVISNMNEMNQAESGLDIRTWTLTRAAALAAVGASTPSYMALLALADDEGVAGEEILGALIAVAPVIGGPRLVTAIMNLVEAAGD
jgi:hypothetical protein